MTEEEIKQKAIENVRNRFSICKNRNDDFVLDNFGSEVEALVQFAQFQLTEKDKQIEMLEQGYVWHDYDAGEDCYEDTHEGRWVKRDEVYQLEQANKQIEELQEENNELKTKIGLSVDCDKAQKNGDLCLGYGGDEDEPCEQCKNCIKCETGYYQLGETEKDKQIEELEKEKVAREIIVRELLKKNDELEVANKKISNECHKLVDTLEKKQNENVDLIGKIAFTENALNNAKAQIEKMKMCENCDHYDKELGCQLVLKKCVCMQYWKLKE